MKEGDRVDLNEFTRLHGEPVKVNVSAGASASGLTFNLIDVGIGDVGWYYRDQSKTSVCALQVSKDGMYGFVMRGCHVAGQSAYYREGESDTGKMLLLQVSNEVDSGLVLTRNF
jgi:hypothetical protein